MASGQFRPQVGNGGLVRRRFKFRAVRPAWGSDLEDTGVLGGPG